MLQLAMRYWAPVLHFYQPPTQAPGLTDWINQTCYQPLLDLLLKHEDIRLTVNISGSLLLQLHDLGATDTISKMKTLINSGQLEVLSTPSYHPLIPLTDSQPVLRQIDQNGQIHHWLFGKDPSRGFFPPELALTHESLEILKNFDYILTGESSINSHLDSEDIIVDSIYENDHQKLVVCSRTMNELLRAHPTSINPTHFIEWLEANTLENSTIFSLSDAEIFGHHYRDRLDFLTTIFSDENFKSRVSIQTISKSLQKITAKPLTKPLAASSWQTTQKNLDENHPFALWNDPTNEFHQGYHELEDLARSSLKSFTDNPLPEDENDLNIARHYFDRGLSSCHVFWLSRTPWWHPELVEAGATSLIKAIRSSRESSENKQLAEKKYRDFLLHMWNFHWSGKIEPYYKRYDQSRSEFVSKLPKLG